MYSERFFKENDALKEFMLFCTGEFGMIPSVSNLGYPKVLTLLGNGIRIKLSISSDPVCIEILSIKRVDVNNGSVIDDYNFIIMLVNKLISCACMYNVMLGAWIEDVDVSIYNNLGFKIVEFGEKIWIEYNQMLN